MATDPWDAFPIVGAAGAGNAPAAQPATAYPATQSAPGVIQGRPKQPDPIELENLRLRQEAADRDQAKFDQEQAEAAQKQQAADAAISDSVGQIRNVIDAAKRAKELSQSGWFATGFGASQAAGIGGTSAADVSALLNTIGANTAFDRLQKMREQSPTGGALGAISERELSLLRDTIASIDQSQSDAQFQANMDKVIAAYQGVLDKIEGPDSQQEEQGDGLGAGQAITYEGANAAPDETPPPSGPVTPDTGGSFLGYRSAADAARDFGIGLGDVVEGAGDVAGLVVNPVGQLFYDATGYGNTVYDLGQILRDATGLPQGDPDSLVSQVNKFGAGALAGGAGARAATSILNPGVLREVASVLGRTPIRDTAAGALAGAGSYAGRESGIPGGEYAGALAGGLAGYKAADSALSAFRPHGANPVGLASARQGVQVLPADVGGPATRAVTSGTKASPLSSGPVVRQAQENTRQLGQAVRRIAEGEGELVTTDAAGENIRAAGQRYSRETSERGARLYERARTMARGVKIKPLQTISEIDQRLARLKEDPSAPASTIQELEGFKSAIENGVSVTGLRDARSRLSDGVYNGQLRSNSDQAMWKGILDNLSSDIDLGLRQAGREDAANTFKRADEFWKQRVEHIDQVLQPIVGRDGTKGGEQVLQSIEAMARGGTGGNARLSRLLAQMTPEEAGQVRAVIVDRLGKATPGAQDAAGEAFSPSTFLTNWNKMTPQAKASLFRNKQLRDDLNDIATLAEGMKASRSMENFSNTTTAAFSNVGAGVALYLANPAALILGAGSQYLTGRLMASPGFARLLAKTAKSSAAPEVAGRRFTEQLGVLAAKEPIIANDIRSIQQFLSEGLSKSPNRAAAQDEGDGRQEIPQQ